MKHIIYILLLLLPALSYSQKCDTEKVDIPGCLVDEDSFLEIIKRICDLETKTDLVDDADANPTNEIQQLSIAGNVITLSLGGGSVTIPAGVSPATSVSNLESDNNESEGSWIRNGNVGTSLLYAREDHQHPIVRLPNPGDPVPVAQGSFVQLQNIILDRGSTEETYWYRFRIRVRQDNGNSWGWIAVPTIAGFQQPVFTELGGYITSSTAVQDDDGSFGASPRGPLMGYPIHHWSSTNRLYGGYYRRDNDINSMYINFVVTYTRT